MGIPLGNCTSNGIKIARPSDRPTNISTRSPMPRFMRYLRSRGRHAGIPRIICKTTAGRSYTSRKQSTGCFNMALLECCMQLWAARGREYPSLDELIKEGLRTVCLAFFLISTIRQHSSCWGPVPGTHSLHNQVLGPFQARRD